MNRVLRLLSSYFPELQDLQGVIRVILQNYKACKGYQAYFPELLMNLLDLAGSERSDKVLY